VHLLQNRRRRLRRRREDEQLEVLEHSPSTSKGPEETLELAESLRRVQRALDTLDIDHRAAFLLYELESESCQTIAEFFDVPVGTVYSRLHKARKMFLRAYQDSESSPTAGLSALACVWGHA
jgi:RNA polymerase sigma-70 factor (ECF subfamily)